MEYLELAFRVVAVVALVLVGLLVGIGLAWVIWGIMGWLFN